MTSPRRRALLATAALLLPATAPAQTAPPQTIPGLENFTLPGEPTPTPTPTPTAVPTPAPTPTPAPVQTPAPASTLPPRTTPPPAPTTAPDPAPTPVASPTPELPPIPVPQTTPAPVATPEPLPAPEPVDAEEENGLLLPVGGAALAAAVAAAWFLRRRRRERPLALEAPQAAPPPPPEPVAPVAPPKPTAPAAAEPEPQFLARPAPPAPRARLALDLRPSRAGVNMVTATVEGEVAVTNTGDAPAEGVRLGVALISAHAGQDAELAEIYARPVARPAAAPFTLAPGETRRVRAVAVLPHEAIKVMTAAGRQMFVPVVAVNALYRAGAGVDGQTAQAFAVGVERVDSPKLAPFWLDRPTRTTDQVAARPHAAAVER